MNKFSIKICNNIAHYRYLAGFTQSQLANIVGVSKNAISAYETGKYSPSLPVALHICHIFGKQFDDIFYVKVVDNF